MQQNVHDHDFVTIPLENGEVAKMSRRDFKNEFLAHQLKQAWNTPDLLANLLIFSFERNFFEEVEDAAKRLIFIDKNSERANSLYGFLLFTINRFHDAEVLYSNYLKLNPESAIIMSNLAKSQFMLGKTSLAMSTLEDVISIIPDLEVTGAWVSFKKQLLIEEGLNAEEANLKALEEACARFNNPQSKVWLGAHYISQQQREMGLQWFEKALQENYDDSALLTISGELGKYDYPEDGIRLVSPLYQPESHRAAIGINLLQSYLTLGRLEEGNELLNTMLDLNLPGIRPELAYFKEAFNQSPLN